MTKNTGNIIDYYDGQLSQRKMKEFEKKLQSEPELREEYLLFCEINDSFRGSFDLEAAMNDPALQEIESTIRESVEEYQNFPELFDASRSFVKDAMNDETQQHKVQSEIDEIKQDIGRNVNELTENWVNEWMEKKQDKSPPDPQTEKLMEFISRSMEDEHVIPLKTDFQEKEDRKRIPIFRYAGFAAAAVIAGTILLTTLIPSGNPEKLYADYYQPMTALSPVTRGNTTAIPQQYNEAVEQYKQGNYLTAASLFSELINQDPDFIAPRFYHGITQMEQGNFEEAIQEFSLLEGSSHEYIKEVQWYLGLSYLKTGDKLKAASYFKMLSESEGYYREPSRKLLRRL